MVPTDGRDTTDLVDKRAKKRRRVGRPPFPLRLPGRLAVKKGPNVGQWIFAFEFPDLAAHEKAWKEVRASPDFKQLNEELRKVGDVVMELLDEIEL
jgi:hypothetical protein